MPSIGQVIVWIIVGLIGGSIAGLAVKGQRGGVGWWRNLLLGPGGGRGWRIDLFDLPDLARVGERVGVASRYRLCRRRLAHRAGRAVAGAAVQATWIGPEAKPVMV